MKFLAIDFGARRLGLAFSDPDGRLALPYATKTRLKNGADWKGDVADLLVLARAHSVEALVFGLPHGLEGEGQSEAPAQKFAARLEAAAHEKGMELPLFWWDERFSTSQALRENREAGISTREGRGDSGANSTDARAAALILQGFLDSQAQHAQKDETS